MSEHEVPLPAEVAVGGEVDRCPELFAGITVELLTFVRFRDALVVLNQADPSGCLGLTCPQRDDCWKLNRQIAGLLGKFQCNGEVLEVPASSMTAPMSSLIAYATPLAVTSVLPSLTMSSNLLSSSFCGIVLILFFAAI